MAQAGQPDRIAPLRLGEQHHEQERRRPPEHVAVHGVPLDQEREPVAAEDALARGDVGRVSLWIRAGLVDDAGHGRFVVPDRARGRVGSSGSGRVVVHAHAR